MALPQYWTVMEDVKLLLLFQKGKGDPKNSQKSYFEQLGVINFDTISYKNYCLLPEKSKIVEG